MQTYNLGDMARLAGVPGGLVIGAGAGSSKVAGVNCEVSPLSATTTPGKCRDFEELDRGKFYSAMLILVDDAQRMHSTWL